MIVDLVPLCENSVNTTTDNSINIIEISELKQQLNNTSKMAATTEKTNNSTSSTDDSPVLEEWGFTLKELYNLAVTFFKDKEGKAMHFSYEERLKLVALTFQVSHGKFDPQTASPLGVLDVIGRDRRLAWQNIGDKSKADCMFEFITTLNKQCPLFKPFVEAHKTNSQEKIRLMKEVEINEQEQLEEYQIAKAIQRQTEEQKIQMEEDKRRIQDELNRQTFSQFKIYAEQQYPGNPEQQAVLIRQLQEQHYEQYMRQVYQQQLFQQQNKRFQQLSLEEQQSNNVQVQQQENTTITSNPRLVDENTVRLPEGANDANAESQQGTEDEERDGASDHEDSSQHCNIAAASMWTRKDVKEFKESVRAEGGEAIIRIGQGESVTVRVPTHAEGTCLFWEFCTDSYDIGFGLLFEWTDADEPVSVQVTEENSSEEEEDLQQVQQDIEKGNDVLLKSSNVNKPNTDVVIPVYRRDAHQEVYVGSHLFPGKGVYLLKFDNSYSFWRSKTLYYRVYYTK